MDVSQRAKLDAALQMPIPAERCAGLSGKRLPAGTLSRRYDRWVKRCAQLIPSWRV